MAVKKTVKKTTKPAVKKTVSKRTVKAVRKTAPKKTEKAMNASVSAPVFDLKGKKTGSTKLPVELFGGKINEQLMAQYVRIYLTNQRQGTASTKTRAEVRGSRRKVWRQKGTGRARHGSITGPIFVGGGIVNGPKPRNFEMKMPKKMKLQALVSALTEKNNEKQIFVINGKLSGKTKEFAAALKSILGSEKKNPSVLFVRNKDDKNAYMASRNIKKVETLEGSNINTFEVIKNNAIVFSKDAIDEMKNTFIKLS
jgi:large subunit ribosomal protein L4